MRKSIQKVLTSLMVLMCGVMAQAEICRNPNLNVVILGSGGPELNDKRASVGYLIREGEKAKILVDLGTATSFNFERANAKIEDLQAVLLSQFHVDHVNDIPALVKGAFFSDRKTDLLIYGPDGNEVVPSVAMYLNRLFGKNGAYSYLSGFMDGREVFRLKPIVVLSDVGNPSIFMDKVGDFQIKSIPVTHSIIPALGWRIEKDGCVIVFSSGTSNMGQTLDNITTDATLFIAHNAIPESSTDHIARKLHMPPSEIGRIAAESKVKSVVLSHFMNRTENVKPETARIIKQHFQGKLSFVQDCDIYSVQSGEKIGSCAKS